MRQPGDETLAVRFYQKRVENEFLSSQEGRPVSEMRDFIRIEIPGNSLSIIDTLASDEHKKRFAMEWAQYHALSDKSQATVQGTALEDWPALTAAQAFDLKHFKFYTVEQVANASDQQIQSIGMLVGMAPFSFRDKAKAYLAAASDSSVVQKQAEELRIREQQMQDMKDQMRQLAERLEAAERRGPGRPRKEAEAA